MKEGTEEEGFVTMREERDGELKEPGLLHQSLQVRPSFLGFFPGMVLMRHTTSRSTFEAVDFLEVKTANLTSACPFVVPTASSSSLSSLTPILFRF